MDLVRHLRFFVAIADEQHFGHAARTLRMSQPPLSQGLRRLEEELGVQLFVRNTREVRLTPAGEELLPRARGLLEASQQFVELARQRRNEGAALRIGTVAQLRPALVAAIGAAAAAVPGIGRVEALRAARAPARHSPACPPPSGARPARRHLRTPRAAGAHGDRGGRPRRPRARRHRPGVRVHRRSRPARPRGRRPRCGRGSGAAAAAVVWSAARPPTSGTRERIEDVQRGEAG